MRGYAALAAPTALALADGNMLWIGTRDGVLSYESAQGSIRRVGGREGLPSSRVVGLAAGAAVAS
eukprot:3013132-Prymnesium_polylepis.1